MNFMYVKQGGNNYGRDKTKTSEVDNRNYLDFVVSKALLFP